MSTKSTQLKARLVQLNPKIWKWYEGTQVNAGAFDTQEDHFQICVFVGQGHCAAMGKAVDEEWVIIYAFHGDVGLRHLFPAKLQQPGPRTWADILAAFSTATPAQQPRLPIAKKLPKVELKPSTSDMTVYILIGILWTFVEMGSYFITQLGWSASQPVSWLGWFLFCLVVFMSGRLLQRLWQRFDEAESAETGVEFEEPTPEEAGQEN